MILLTVPLFFPVVTSLGYDPIWFGIIVVIVVQIGLISPPVGMNIFVVKNLLRHLSIAHGVPRRDAVHRRAGRPAGGDRGVPGPRDLAAGLYEVSRPYATGCCAIPALVITSPQRTISSDDERSASRPATATPAAACRPG